MIAISFAYCVQGLRRPNLEYCKQAWHSRLKKQEITTEGVQRRATKIIDELKSNEYCERRKELDLPNLQYCRGCATLIEMYE